MDTSTLFAPAATNVVTLTYGCLVWQNLPNRVVQSTLKISWGVHLVIPSPVFFHPFVNSLEKHCLAFPSNCFVRNVMPFFKWLKPTNTALKVVPAKKKTKPWLPAQSQGKILGCFATQHPQTICTWPPRYLHAWLCITPGTMGLLSDSALISGAPRTWW